MTFFSFYSFPYDWTAPNKYMISIIFQAVVVLCNVEIYITVLILFFGFCHFLTAFVVHIELDIQQLNDCAATNHSKRLKKNLIAIIQFHSEAKQLRDATFTSEDEREFIFEKKIFSGLLIGFLTPIKK